MHGGDVVDIEQRRRRELSKYLAIYSDPEKSHYGRPGKPLQTLVRHLLEKPGKGSLVDLSCGHGIAMEIARELGYTPVKGTETVPLLLSDDVVYALAHDLPFDDRSFDVVLSTGVVEHLLREDVVPALTEMARVARQQVIVTTNNKPSYYHIFCPRYDEWDQIFRNAFRGWEVIRHNDCGLGGKNMAWRMIR